MTRAAVTGTASFWPFEKLSSKVCVGRTRSPRWFVYSTDFSPSCSSRVSASETDTMSL